MTSIKKYILKRSLCQVINNTEKERMQTNLRQTPFRKHKMPEDILVGYNRYLQILTSI